MMSKKQAGEYIVIKEIISPQAWKFGNFMKKIDSNRVFTPCGNDENDLGDIGENDT